MSRGYRSSLRAALQGAPADRAARASASPAAAISSSPICGPSWRRSRIAAPSPPSASRPRARRWPSPPSMRGGSRIISARSRRSRQLSRHRRLPRCDARHRLRAAEALGRARAQAAGHRRRDQPRPVADSRASGCSRPTRPRSAAAAPAASRSSSCCARPSPMTQIKGYVDQLIGEVAGQPGADQRRIQPHPRQAADQGDDRPAARRRSRRRHRRHRPHHGDAARRPPGDALQHERRAIRRRHPGRGRGPQHAAGAAVDLSDRPRRRDGAALQPGQGRGGRRAQGADPLQPAALGDDHRRARRRAIRSAMR